MLWDLETKRGRLPLRSVTTVKVYTTGFLLNTTESTARSRSPVKAGFDWGPFRPGWHHRQFHRSRPCELSSLFFSLLPCFALVALRSGSDSQYQRTNHLCHHHHHFHHHHYRHHHHHRHYHHHCRSQSRTVHGEMEQLLRNVVELSSAGARGSH